MRFFGIVFCLFFGLVSVSQAQLNLNPAPVSGSIELTSSQTYVYFTNSGSSTLSPILSIDSNSSGVSISINRCSTLKPAASCYIVVSFSNYGKLKTATSVSLRDNGNQLSLLSYSPAVSVVQSSSFSISSLTMNDFSNYNLSITNNTLSSKSYSPIFSGANASKYSIALNRCSNIPAGGKCDVIIKLAPQLAGSYSASLSEAQVTGSVSLSSSISSLTVGVISPPNPSISVSPSSVDFGTITKLGQTTLKTVTITNNGNVSISPIISTQGTGLNISLNRCLVLLGVGQSCTVSLYFDAVSSMSNGVQSGLSLSAKPTLLSSESLVSNLVSLNIPLSMLIAPPAQAIASQIFAGGEHSCVIFSDTSVKCTGSNWSGQLGDGSFVDKNVPVSVPGFYGAKKLFLGYGQTCAIMSDDSVKCVGSNYFGELGDGTGVDKSTPVTISDFNGAKMLATGGSHTCAIMGDDSVKCVGYNAAGQLGDSTNAYKLTPVVISGFNGAKKIFAGMETTCAIMSDDSVKCTGQTFSLIGDGKVSNPTVMSNLSGAKTMAIGDSHSCAIMSDDSVKCSGWGSPFGAGNIQLSPTTIAHFNGAKEIHLGGFHTCFKGIDDSFRCNGFNYAGQLGDGTTAYRATPILTDFASAKKIATGYEHTCAIMQDDSVVCSGYNWGGQLGDGTFIDRSAPSIMILD